MLRTKFFSTSISAAAILALSTFAACDNGKTDTSATTTPADTSSVMKVDSSATTSAPAPTDTASIAPSAAATDVAGTAKPNAAKKGLKGKATITIPSKGSGSMDADNTGVYSNVEYLPSFPGGNKGLQKFFDDNLKYPTTASDEGVEGTVNVSFVVDENGRLTSPQVQGQNPGYGLETEALRVVNKMPSWNPGKLKGKNVKTRFTLPVVFQLY